MKVFLSLFCLLYAVKASAFANKTKLHKDLFTNYEKDFRPDFNQIIPTELDISFYFRSLKEIQESNGEMGVVGSLGVEWIDVRLAWNPSDYGGNLNQTSVVVDDIWTPYLVLMNPYEEINPILSGEFSCKLWYNGYVSCLPPPNIHEALCIADVRFYPFDSKICTLQLYVSGYHSSELKFKNQSKTFNMEMFVNNGPWSIKRTLIFVQTIYINNKSVEILKLDVSMQRISDRDVWDLFPIIVLSGIQIVVFYLPHETGERISFSVTVLLAEVVFLTVIQEKIPETSKTDTGISYLLYKQLTDLMISFIIVAAVALTSFCHYTTKTEEPEETEETLSKMQSLRMRKQTEQPEDEEAPSKMESLGMRKQSEQPEETEGTPSKMECSRMRTQTEQPKESEETPSKIESLRMRKQTKGHKSGENFVKKLNLYFFVVCLILIALSNTLFFWKMNAF